MILPALQLGPSSPSFFSYWRELLELFGAFGVVIGVVIVIVFDAAWVKAFNRCKREVMSCLDEWYKKRIDDNAEARRQVEINSDRLEAFEAAQVEQGKAFKGLLDNHFANNTVAMQGMTVALQAVQREAQATAESVARIEGVLEATGWDGNNRRKRTRRSPGGVT